MQRIGTTKSFAQHKHINRGERIDAMQVLCSASAQQNHLHNTSTAIEEKAIVLFKCCAAHRHNKIICTTQAQQSRKKRCCYSSVVQRIGTTKSFAQHQHSTPGKKGGAIQVLCNTSAQQNLVVRLLCTPQSVVHSICTTKNRGWRTGGSGRAERAVASFAGSRSPRAVSFRCEKAVEARRIQGKRRNRAIRRGGDVLGGDLLQRDAPSKQCKRVEGAAGGCRACSYSSVVERISEGGCARVGEVSDAFLSRSWGARNRR